MMIKPDKVKVNTIAYTLYQCLLFVIPLIILPYLTRVMGEEALGEYSFSYSIAYYFVLASNLGIATYGQREIAQARHDDKSLSKTFWSLYYLHFISSLVSTLAFIGFAFLQKEALLYFCLIPYVVSALFDVTWLFYGLEKFKYVTIINGVFSIAKSGFIFIFVKSSADIHLYQLISFLTVLLENIVSFTLANKIVGKPVKVAFKDLKKHIVPLLYFALSIIAISLYTTLDKTLLGILSETKNITYYECADKIIAVPRTLITIFGTILFPRICSIANESNEAKANRYTDFSTEITCFASFGSIFGILAIGSSFTLFYYGPTYQEAGNALLLMSPLILIVSLGSICRSQFILPYKKDKVFLFSVGINAITNIVLSVAFIPIIGLYGAIIGSFFAELAGIIFQWIYCRKKFSFKYVVKTAIPYFFIGLSMFILLEGFEHLFKVNTILKIIIFIALGAIYYISLSLLFLSKTNRIRKLRAINE